MAEFGTRFTITVTVTVVVVIVAVTVDAVLTTVCRALRCSACSTSTQKGDQILCRVACSAQILLLRNSSRLRGSVSAVAVVGRVVIVGAVVVIVTVVAVIIHVNRSVVYCRGQSSRLLCTASTATATVTVHTALRSIRMPHSSPDPLPLSLPLAVAVSAVSIVYGVRTITRARVRALVPAQHRIVVVSRLVVA